MFAQTAIVALFAGLVAAQAAPKGEPSGNPITRPLNEIVPACKPFTITWQPTTPNSVSLLLLRGPSTNVVPLGPPIVVGIPNSGSFVWTPPSSLEADTTHYGLQLIDDITGQYQYSTQFGISKDAACNSYVTPSASSSQYGGGYPVSTPVGASSKASSVVVPSSAPVAVSSKVASTVVTKPSPVVPPYPTVPAGNNATIVLPSGTGAIPSGARPSGIANTTRPGLPESTGAASGLKAGLGFVGAAAAFAFML